MPLDPAAASSALKPQAIEYLQVAAIPVRQVDGLPQVLLVTTRGHGNWIVPKGWPLHDTSHCESAKREAFEEAGVIGRVEPVSLGAFAYWKGAGKKRCFFEARAYALEVQNVLSEWPEREARKRCWFSPETAQGLVKPDLGALIFTAVYGACEVAQRPAGRTVHFRRS